VSKQANAEDLANAFRGHLEGLNHLFHQLLEQHDSVSNFSPHLAYLENQVLPAPLTEKMQAQIKAEKTKAFAMLRETSPESPGLSAVSGHSMQELEDQYERLDLECNGKLNAADLQHVVQEFGNGWEVEDMLSLIDAAVEVRSQLRKDKSVGKLKNRADSKVGIFSEYGMVDFETFKVLVSEDLLTSDALSWSQQSDIRILRDALLAEQTWSLYQDDGHLKKQAANEKGKESSLQRKAHTFFDLVPPLVIVLNVVVVGLSVDMQKSDPNNPVWQVLEIVFLTFYFFEAVGKMGVFGCAWYFFGEDHLWNWFDFTCLLLSLGDLALFIYVEISQVENPLDLQTLMLVKMLRLARLARLIRTLRFAIFYELKLMVLGVISGMRVLAWAMVLLALLIYAAAIATTSLFGGDENIPEMKSVSRSMFTLFRCFTDGCVARDGTPLSERLYDIHGLVWVIPYVILFVGVTLGLFNLIMAIFIDNVMASQMQRKLQEISNTAKTVEIRLKEQLLRVTLQSKSNGVPADVEDEIVGLDHHYHSHAARVRAKFDRLVGAEVAVTKAAFLSWLRDREFLHVLKDADIETANESGIYDVLDADMSNSLSIEEVYVGLMRLRGPIAKSEIVGLILRLRHVTTMLGELSRGRSR